MENLNEMIQKVDLSLTDLYDQARDSELTYTDYVAKTGKRMYVESCESENVLNWMTEGAKSVDREGVLTDHSLTQLCGKLNIPVRYMKKCQKGGINSLLDVNVNTWLDRHKGDFFLRTVETDENSCIVRGVLSNRYSVLDTADILSTLKDVDYLQRNYRIKSQVMNYERLHLRLISNDKLDIGGEDLFMGVQVDSSDVGRSALNVQVMIYKQVCTNGLVLPQSMGTLFRQKHFGITIPDFQEGLVASLGNLHDIAWNAEILIARSRVAKMTKLFNKDEETVTRYKDLLKVSDKTMQEIIDTALSGTYDKTKWGFINSVTEVAQKFTLETRLDMEKRAGQILLVA